ncbi:flagellar hook-length control protein FliK [Thermosipho ferrireducens]|uniref:Flagellar hook-length control protein FliK n=1 Tax=Thermosipho ferrireducens TaxID=2571116 RepID=A0ABX7SA00_9BACT|nr:flagellar hook-length control protein FliK [Thermosipho ferrireducens]QTA38766.1 flagellar hook-length control protein FliK [Thermosipho ferrireducens]
MTDLLKTIALIKNQKNLNTNSSQTPQKAEEKVLFSDILKDIKSKVNKVKLSRIIQHSFKDENNISESNKNITVKDSKSIKKVIESTIKSLNKGTKAPHETFQKESDENTNKKSFNSSESTKKNDVKNKNFDAKTILLPLKEVNISSKVNQNNKQLPEIHKENKEIVITKKPEESKTDQTLKSKKNNINSKKSAEKNITSHLALKEIEETENARRLFHGKKVEKSKNDVAEKNKALYRNTQKNNQKNDNFGQINNSIKNSKKTLKNNQNRYPVSLKKNNVQNNTPLKQSVPTSMTTSKNIRQETKTNEFSIPHNIDSIPENIIRKLKTTSHMPENKQNNPINNLPLLPNKKEDKPKSTKENYKSLFSKKTAGSQQISKQNPSKKLSNEKRAQTPIKDGFTPKSAILLEKSSTKKEQNIALTPDNLEKLSVKKTKMNKSSVTNIPEVSEVVKSLENNVSKIASIPETSKNIVILNNVVIQNKPLKSQNIVEALNVGVNENSPKSTDNKTSSKIYSVNSSYTMATNNYIKNDLEVIQNTLEITKIVNTSQNLNVTIKSKSFSSKDEKVVKNYAFETRKVITKIKELTNIIKKFRSFKVETQKNNNGKVQITFSTEIKRSNKTFSYLSKNTNSIKPNISDTFKALTAKKAYKPIDNHQQEIPNFDKTINFNETGKNFTDKLSQILLTHESKNIENIYNKIQEMLNQPKIIEKANINLAPPELGNIEIEVEKEGNEILIKFLVENKEAKELLDKGSYILRERLGNLGFEIKDFVIETKEEQEWYEEQKEKQEEQRNNQQNQKRQKQRWVIDDDELDTNK